MNKEFEVKGMHCKSCEYLIKEGLLEKNGVSEVNASAADGKIKISFDENKISELKIKETIREKGYKVK